MAIIDDIKRSYRNGSMLMRLIYINIGVFVLVHVIGLVVLLFTGNGTHALQWLELPSSVALLIRRPWTLVTYMFTHYSLIHILFNMLWLYWLGSVFMDYFMPKQLAGLYLLGGLGGGVLYVLAYNTLPYLIGNPSYLLGASAAVIAIVVAAAIQAPDRKMGLLFLGEVSIKWIAIVTVAISVLGIDGGNVGGNIAHVGGALVGTAFALGIKRGHDITAPLNGAIDAVVGIFKPNDGRGEDVWSRPVRKSKKKQQKRQQAQQQQEPASTQSTTANDANSTRMAGGITEEELDAILIKLKTSGYDALSDEEKSKLFNASRRREA